MLHEQIRLGSNRFDTVFLEQRRQWLQVYVDELCQNIELAYSPIVAAFLQYPATVGRPSQSTPTTNNDPLAVPGGFGSDNDSPMMQNGINPN
eukprot:SAG31_NODE_5730_length_2356_cov_1.278245_2_plen_92_part_00